MRIVAGKHANRELTSPGKRVRPTAERIRVAWMDWLAEEIKGARILELFAGTGAVGLEALSRGAWSVDFVERDPAAFHSLKANVAKLRERNHTRIFKRDAIPFLAGIDDDGYDLVLADPPYNSAVSKLLVDRWKAIKFSPLLAVEHATAQDMPKGDRTLDLHETTITLYKQAVK